MKKLTFVTALLGLLALTGCGGTGSSKDDLLPVFTWEGNPRYAVLEIGKNMDGVVTADVPGGVAVLTVTAKIPTKLVGMAEQMIGISANKQGDVLVFDLIQDKTANSALSSKGFTSVSSGSQSFKMDFDKLLKAVIGSAEVPSGAEFKFTVHLEDRSGNKKDFTAHFRWTAAPSFALTGQSPYLLEKGTKEKLIVEVTAPGKIESFTVSFGGGSAASEILTDIRNRTQDGSTVVDLINDPDAATALKLPTNLAKATSAKLDFSTWCQEQWSYNVQKTSITVVTLHVEDVLGKSSEFEVQLIKE